MPSTDRVVTASDLAEYAYCPRAHYYRHHPPAGGPSRESVDRARYGTRVHERTLLSEQRREAHAAAYVAGLGVGLLVLMGGIAWLFLH